jgi:excisionase family DNA binding protein
MGMPKRQQNRIGDGGGWWNIRRASQYLAMSEAFVRKFVRLRQIPFVRVGSKSVRFRKTDLDDWVHGRKK